MTTPTRGADCCPQCGHAWDDHGRKLRTGKGKPWVQGGCIAVRGDGLGCLCIQPAPGKPVPVTTVRT